MQILHIAVAFLLIVNGGLSEPDTKNGSHNSTHNIPNCCINGENVLKDKKCPGNYTTEMQTCEHGRYILDMGNYDIEENPLPLEDVLINGTYCIAKIYETKETVLVVCFSEQDGYDHDDYGSNMFGTAAMGISIICLLITLIVYIILPELRDLQGKCLMCVISSLAVGFTMLGILQQHQHMDMTSCVFSAFLTYFSMIITFFWLNVISINVWRLVRFPKFQLCEKKLFVYYCAYAFGVSFLFLIVAVIAQLSPGEHIHPGFGISKCWFHGEAENWLYFYGPITVLLFVNTVLFIDTGIIFCRQVAPTENPTSGTGKKMRSNKAKCLLYLKLFIIMGLSWIFEPLSFLVGTHGDLGVFWTIMDYVNMLQGVLIFALLILTRKRVLRGLARAEICCGFRAAPAHFAQLPPDDECSELVQDAQERPLESGDAIREANGNGIK